MSTDHRHPTGDGDKTGTWTVYPASPTTRYDKIDEDASDDADYIYCTAVGRSHFTFSAFSLPAEATSITVTVYFRIKKTTSSTCHIYSEIKIGANYYASDHRNPTTSYVTNSYAYTTNPSTGFNWTPAEVNALSQFGVGVDDASPNPYCSWCYIEVTYAVEKVYNGNIPLSVLPESPAGVRDAVFSGNIPISLVPSAAIIREYVTAGAITLNVLPGTPKGIMDIPFSGNVPMVILPNSMYLLSGTYVYNGDVPLVILPDTLKAFLEKSYSGNVDCIILPNSDYLLDTGAGEFVYAGDLPVTFLPNSLYVLESPEKIYSGNISMTILPSCSVEFAEKLSRRLIASTDRHGEIVVRLRGIK